MGRKKDGRRRREPWIHQECSGPLRAHLQLLLLAQRPEQGDLLLVPGRDTQDLVPAGRQRGHREGTLAWGEAGEAPHQLRGLENASVGGVERKKKKCRFRAAVMGKERILGGLR